MTPCANMRRTAPSIPIRLADAIPSSTYPMWLEDE